MLTHDAFLSYPTASDRSGKIALLRESLEEEVRLLTGAPDFRIYDDPTTGLGREWPRQLVDDRLPRLLLPLVQPLLFNNQTCRGDLEGFLELERVLGRSDLILPLYYIDCDDLTPQSDDHLRRTLAARQMVDCRRIRQASEDKVNDAAAGIARRMVEAFRRSARPVNVAGAPQLMRSAAPMASNVVTTDEAPATDIRQPGPELHAALVHLLLSLFSSDEFLRFLRFNSETAALSHRIPGGAVAPMTLVDAAVRELAREGLIDRAFFDRLIAERPRRAPEIRRICALLPGE